MDVSFLKEIGGDYALRAQEIYTLFARWHKERSPEITSNPLFQEYLATYGDFTPIVILPVPAGTSRRALPYRLRSAPSAALMASGRLVIADVRGPPVANLGIDPTWRSLALGEMDYRQPLNSSPINAERLYAVLDHAQQRLFAILRKWSQKRTQRIQQHLGAPDAGRSKILGSESAPYHFISYSRKNSARVRSICDHLVKIGVAVWFDQDSIEEGEDFLQAIVEGIDGCESVVPFCSQSHSDSKWCRREVWYADDIDKPFLPVWLTDPALFGAMKLLLGQTNALIIEQVPTGTAADMIAKRLAAGF